MSNIKRLAFPEAYELLDTVRMNARAILEDQARHVVCQCYLYDFNNVAGDLSAEELRDTIDNPYIGHGDDIEDCPEWQAEHAETIRDGLREDGVA